jgi:hypothetical protein
VCVLPRIIFISLRAVNRIRGISSPSHTFAIHTHLLFESKREKQLGDTGDVERRRSYLDVNAYLPRTVTIIKFFLSHRHSHVKRRPM